MKRIRSRLTYANVVASLALFLSLAGGGAFAATQLGKNSVGTSQLRKGAVTAAKLKKNAVTTSRIKNRAVTGRKIRLSTVGKVPAARQADNAGKLGGLPAGGFLQGDGTALSARTLLQLGGGGDQHVLDLPGYGELVGGCGSGGGALWFKNTVGFPLRVISARGSEFAVDTLLADGDKSTGVGPGPGGVGVFIFQVGETDYGSQPLLTVFASTDAQGGQKCGVQAWAIEN